MDCQARHKRQLDFAFNASFASLNAAKVFIKDNGMDNSMAKVKSLMFNANYTKLLFDMSRCRPNRTLISRVVKELIGWQPKAAQPYTQILTNYCYYSNVFLTRTGFVIPNATFSFANRLPLLLHLLLRGVKRGVKWWLTIDKIKLSSLFLGKTTLPNVFFFSKKFGWYILLL